MEIVQIHTSDTGGGAEVLMTDVHHALLRYGHGSTVYVGKKLSHDPRVHEIPHLRGVPGVQRICRWLEHRYGLENLYQPGFRALARSINQNTDAVVVRGLTGADRYADVVALKALTRRFPTLLWMDDMWLMTGHCGLSLDCRRWMSGCGHCPDLNLYPAIPSDGTRINFIRKRRILQRCNLYVAGPSEYLLNLVSQSAILGRFPRSVIPNGIDLEVFRPADRLRARQKLGLPADAFLVMVGANHLISPFKPARHAVTAINSLGSQQKIAALLVGNNSEEIHRELTVDAWAMPHTVDRSLLASYYQSADIFLLPSMEETFGLMAAEAMACGCCVVAYASGALPELIDHDETGILVERGSPTALGEALARLYARPERIVQIGLAAANRAKERFGFEKHISLFLDLLHELVAARTGTRATSGCDSPVRSQI